MAQKRFYHELAVGARFGRWTVLSGRSPKSKKSLFALCRCDCGVEREVESSRLRTGRSASCGCIKSTGCRPHARPKFEIVAGTRIGRWTVLSGRSSKSNAKGLYALCRCVCGVEREVQASSLRKGESQSCGCAPSTFTQTAQRRAALVVVNDKKRLPFLLWLPPKQARRLLIMEIARQRQQT